MLSRYPAAFNPIFVLKNPSNTSRIPPRRRTKRKRGPCGEGLLRPPTPLPSPPTQRRRRRKRRNPPLWRPPPRSPSFAAVLTRLRGVHSIQPPPPSPPRRRPTSTRAPWWRRLWRLRPISSGRRRLRPTSNATRRPAPQPHLLSPPLAPA